MPFMRGQQGAERLREWSKQQREIRAKCARRRARVLRHEWACARLCQILNLADARRWNGFVPPAKDADGNPNRLPSRLALIELLREIDRVETEAGIGPEETE